MLYCIFVTSLCTLCLTHFKLIFAHNSKHVIQISIFINHAPGHWKKNLYIKWKKIVINMRLLIYYNLSIKKKTVNLRKLYFIWNLFSTFCIHIDFFCGKLLPWQCGAMFISWNVKHILFNVFYSQHVSGNISPFMEFFEKYWIKHRNL